MIAVGYNSHPGNDVVTVGTVSHIAGFDNVAVCEPILDKELERIDKLGVYFTYHNILERFDITFKRFVDMVNNGVWEEFITTHQNSIRYLKNKRR